MQNAPLFHRRDFLTIMSVASVQFLFACSSADNSNSNVILGDNGNCLANGTETEIQLIHSPNHILFISKDDINSAMQKTFTLDNNGSGHEHTVTLSETDFNQLKNNNSIRKVTSIESGHSHNVDIRCL